MQLHAIVLTLWYLLTLQGECALEIFTTPLQIMHLTFMSLLLACGRTVGVNLLFLLPVSGTAREQQQLLI
jgi:hypothetical protein